MRTFTIREALATVITLAVIVPFVGYSIRGSMPFVQDPRGMAGVGVAGVLLFVLTYAQTMFHRSYVGIAMAVLAVATLGFGTAALWAETNWALLVPMVGGLLTLWLVALARDSGLLPRPPAGRSA